MRSLKLLSARSQRPPSEASGLPFDLELESGDAAQEDAWATCVGREGPGHQGARVEGVPQPRTTQAPRLPAVRTETVSAPHTGEGRRLEAVEARRLASGGCVDAVSEVGRAIPRAGVLTGAQRNALRLSWQRKFAHCTLKMPTLQSIAVCTSRLLIGKLKAKTRRKGRGLRVGLLGSDHLGLSACPH